MTDDHTRALIKDLTPFLTTFLALTGVVAGWLVSRRNTRLDKLREAWANFAAAAHEALEKQSAALQREAVLKKGGGPQEQTASLNQLLVLDRNAAENATWALRRSFQMLLLLEHATEALHPAWEITNHLLTDILVDNEHRFLDARMLVERIVHTNRRRFLPRTKRHARILALSPGFRPLGVPADDPHPLRESGMTVSTPVIEPARTPSNEKAGDSWPTEQE